METTHSYSLSFVFFHVTLELQCTVTKRGLECEWGVSLMNHAPDDAVDTHLLRRFVC